MNENGIASISPSVPSAYRSRTGTNFSDIGVEDMSGASYKKEPLLASAFSSSIALISSTCQTYSSRAQPSNLSTLPSPTASPAIMTSPADPHTRTWSHINGSSQDVLDRYAVSELCKGWPVYRDASEWKNYRSLFTDDACVWTSTYLAQLTRLAGRSMLLTYQPLSLEQRLAR